MYHKNIYYYNILYLLCRVVDGTLGLIGEHGPLVPAKHGNGIFLQLPVRNAAGTARSFEPFVSEPPGGTAVAGVVDHESAVAVGRDPGLVAHLFDGANTVQHALARRPQLDLVDQAEQLDPFPEKAFLRGFWLFAHCFFILTAESQKTQRLILKPPEC